MRQFETYLRARGIEPEPDVTTKAPVTQSSKGKRRKRSTEKPISGTLSSEKVWRVCHSTSIVTLFHFKSDEYVLLGTLVKILGLFIAAEILQ